MYSMQGCELDRMWRHATKIKPFISLYDKKEKCHNSYGIFIRHELSNSLIGGWYDSTTKRSRGAQPNVCLWFVAFKYR